MERMTVGTCVVITMDLVERLDAGSTTDHVKAELQHTLETSGEEFVEWAGWQQSQVQLADGGRGMRFIGRARCKS